YTITSDAAAQTVTLNLGTPFPDSLINLTQPSASIICPAEQTLINQNVTDKVVGSGPFTMTEAIHSDHVTLQARPDWNWGPRGETRKDPGYPGRMVVHIISNETTAANELIAGGLEVGSVSGPDVPRLQADKSLNKVTYSGSWLSPLVFNQITAGGLMRDPTMRQAGFTAVDPQAFLPARPGGLGGTTTHPLPPPPPRP